MPVLTVLNCWVKKSTTFTLTIIHLVYPPKFCISIVFKFSWEDCKYQEKLETMLMQNFFEGKGVNKVYYGNGKVVNFVFLC